MSIARLPSVESYGAYGKLHVVDVGLGSSPLVPIWHTHTHTLVHIHVSIFINIFNTKTPTQLSFSSGSTNKYFNLPM